MVGTGERLLELLALLQSRQLWTGSELTEHLEISARTLRRDVERLRSLGYPVHATTGTGGGYQLGPGARMPPLQLTGEEAIATVLGLQYAANLPISEMSDTAARALIKVIDILPASVRKEAESASTAIQMSAITGPNVSFDNLTTISRSIRDSERTRFDYQDTDGNKSNRLTEPHQLVALHRCWYLLAWDLDRKDWRTFRLDRITKPHITKRRFELRQIPAESAAIYIADQLATLPTAHNVEVIVKSSLETVKHQLGPWGIAEPCQNESIRIKMNVNDLSWVVLLLAGLNTEIEVVKPAELKQLLHTLASRFVRSPGTEPP